MNMTGLDFTSYQAYRETNLTYVMNIQEKDNNVIFHAQTRSFAFETQLLMTMELVPS